MSTNSILINFIRLNHIINCDEIASFGELTTLESLNLYLRFFIYGLNLIIRKNKIKEFNFLES